MNSVISGEAEVRNNYFVVRADPSRTSATLIEKVLVGVFKDFSQKVVVLKWGGNYYLPQEKILRSGNKLMKGLKQELWRGYVKVKEIPASEE